MNLERSEKVNQYNPPYEITNKIMELAMQITYKLEKLDNLNGFEKMPILRKNNRINSIYSSLKIEANSLSFEQVKDVINGKVVSGPEKEILEVKNAYRAYEKISDIDPFSLDDLKKVHQIMTDHLIENPGEFRNCSEGVFENGECIFIAPPSDLVPKLMNDLFAFLNQSKNKIHPLVLSSIFHYEFVFIHPFKDGNGRMARLWQTALLAHHKEIFAYIPIETQIKKHQAEYYEAISNSNINGESTVFIEFILSIIDKALSEAVDISLEIVTLDLDNMAKLLNILSNKALSAEEVLEKLNISSIEKLYSDYLKPGIKLELIQEITIDNTIKYLKL